MCNGLRKRWLKVMRLMKQSVILFFVATVLAACSDKQAVGKGASTSQASPVTEPKKVAVARGKIEVKGGLIAVASKSNGVVNTLLIGEGDTVKRGQLLLNLDDSTAQKAADVASAEVKLWRERLRANELRLPALQAEAVRFAEAADEGASPPQSADAARQRLADAQANVAEMKAELEVALKRWDMTKGTLGMGILTAPQDGTVVRVDTQPGAYVQTGATVLTLLPNQPLIVRAELNAAYVDAVRTGMRATILPDMDGADFSKRLPMARVVRIVPIYAQGKLQEQGQRGPIRVVDCVLEFDSRPQVRVGENVRVIFHE